MHIPENYLSPSTCAALGAAMLPAWYIASARVKKELAAEKLPLLGVGAAFAFLGMMFNVPLPGGTTGHAVGGTLLAILFGPFAACLEVSVALLLQAVFFGDGGVLALGANCFNMALVLPFVGYGVFRALRGRVGFALAAGLGAYVGLNAAALCAAVEFGIQPLLFTDAAGRALYCPYPLSISVPAMMAGHLTLFGAVEALFTVAVLSYIKKTAPSLLGAGEAGGSRPVYGLIGALIVLTPLGLLAEGTAWGEWAPEEMAELTEGGAALGYTPSGMEGWSLEVLFPDYTVGAMPEALGYILSAVIGTALLVIIFKLAASFGGRSGLAK